MCIRDRVNIDLLETRAGLNGKNTKENKALYLWADYAADIRLKSVFFERTLSNYEDFFPEFEAYVAGPVSYTHLFGGLVSCNDWLDVKTETEMTLEEMYADQQGFQDALTGAYLELKNSSAYGTELMYGTIEYLAQHWDCLLYTSYPELQALLLHILRRRDRQVHSKY